MPELQRDDAREPRRVEIHVESDEGGNWRRGTIVARAGDARMKIRFDDDPGHPETHDLAECRYRWLHGEAERDWDAQE